MSPPRKPSGSRVVKARLGSRSGVSGPLGRIRGSAAQRPVPVNPQSLGAPKGFTHGWLAPSNARMLFVAGQTAVDARGRIVDTAFAAQFDAALARVLTVVEAAGGGPEHVMRMTVYVTDIDAYQRARDAIGERWRARMGRHYPAMALVEVSRLVDEGALVEIEATAAVPSSLQETRE